MIEIDTRVGSAELEPYFKQLGQPYCLKQLKYGDFAFIGNGPNGTLVRVAIERKTWPDFLASTTSSRFNGDQLVGLLEDYDDVYLYLEGSSRCNPDNFMFEYKATRSLVWTTGYGKPTPWHVVRSKITTFEHCGIRTNYPEDAMATANHVSNLYQWYRRPWEEHNSHRQIKEIKMDVSRATKVARVARALGLGHQGARRAELAFKTVKEMVNAEVDDWFWKDVVKTTAQAKKLWGMCN